MGEDGSVPPTDEVGRGSGDDIEDLVARCVAALETGNEAILEQVCAEHPQHADALRARIREIDSLAERLGAPAESAPKQIGPYRILEVLGEGGMGTVYLAEQRGEVQRSVALKVVKLGMDTKLVLARFEAERQALALMDHANIAKVLDAGSTERGQPFFVMELVKGVPITDFCDRYRLSVTERIRLFKQVCDGVQHAHQKRIIHRDIKPNNVLVGMLEDEPMVKIIDFGLARASDRRLGEHTVHTEHGTVLGTLHYMSPEQVEMSGLDIDARTDVYSLGVLLYELLVGDVPLKRESFRTAGLLEVQRMILEQVPVAPSRRLLEYGESALRVAELRAASVRGLRQELRGDLDGIVIKALEKDRRLRYQTPTQLVADLDRFLHDEPVQASHATLSYRMQKFVRRYRRQVASVLVLVALLVGALVLTLAAKGEAQSALTDFQRLADRVKLAELEERADELWPEVPERAPEMETWLRDVEAWLVAMPDHEQSLTELRQRPLAAPPPDVNTWLFKDPNDQFLHDALADLVDAKRAFEADDGPIARVRRSLEWARVVRDETLTAFRHEWGETIEAVRAKSEYDGLALTPQVGLVPLGPDPQTGLLEFWLMRSGTRPERDPDGRFVIGKDTGMVFVLLPAGRLRMGSQVDDPDQPNYCDPRAMVVVRPNELRPHMVSLRAFFLSKYELTQAQWMRLSGSANPSRYTTETQNHESLTLANPVEMVDYVTVEKVLRRQGLDLPTEAQWEYACRAGTDTPWYTGSVRETLNDPEPSVNIADGYDLRPLHVQWTDSALWPEYHDEFFWHAPVGSFPPNPFGLHEMLGNVWEWTRDPHAPYDPTLHAEGDGAWKMPAGSTRVVRGGAFGQHAGEARAARRTDVPVTSGYDNIGVRPARAIDP